jgi:hypothetical protein
MSDETKEVQVQAGEEKEAAAAASPEKVQAPVSSICDDAQKNAASKVKDDSEIKPVKGFFLTSQRWH